jgi:5'-methylthioadenosine phosphorylase
MVTDFDCWHPNHDNVTVEAIVKVLLANADHARNMVKVVAPLIYTDPHASICKCHSALEFALITSPDACDPEIVKKLDAILGRVLKLD